MLTNVLKLMNDVAAPGIKFPTDSLTPIIEDYQDSLPKDKNSDETFLAAVEIAITGSFKLCFFVKG